MGPLVDSHANATGCKVTLLRGSPTARRLPPEVGARSTLIAAGLSNRRCWATSTTPSTVAQEEIFGPVLSVIPAEDEQRGDAIANDSIYGLNASVFTNDVERARDVASQLRSGTVGHNAFRTDFSIAFGGFKQSGIGREGGVEGLLPFLETKTVILEGRPRRYGA